MHYNECWIFVVGSYTMKLNCRNLLLFFFTSYANIVVLSKAVLPIQLELYDGFGMEEERRKETMTPVWTDMSKEWITSGTGCSRRQKQTLWMLNQNKNEITTENMAKGRSVCLHVGSK